MTLSQFAAFGVLAAIAAYVAATILCLTLDLRRWWAKAFLAAVAVVSCVPFTVTAVAFVAFEREVNAGQAEDIAAIFLGGALLLFGTPLLICSLRLIDYARFGANGWRLDLATGQVRRLPHREAGSDALRG